MLKPSIIVSLGLGSACVTYGEWVGHLQPPRESSGRAGRARGGRDASLPMCAPQQQSPSIYFFSSLAVLSELEIFWHLSLWLLGTHDHRVLKSEAHIPSCTLPQQPRFHKAIAPKRGACTSFLPSPSTSPLEPPCKTRQGKAWQGRAQGGDPLLSPC